jgi:hypothetical protein
MNENLIMEATTILQVHYLMSNTIQSRIGLVCLYQDKILIGNSHKELHQMLQLLWP